MKRMQSLTLAVGLVLLFAGTALADSQPAGPLSASLEVDSVAAKAGGGEVIGPAGSAAPGKVLQYTGHYTNVSANPLAGVIINGQIPPQTSFVPAGLSASLGAAFEVQVAGEPWQAVPAYKHVKQADGSMARVAAVPADYQQIRWRVTEPLAPGGTFVSIYRVQIDK